ncbi:MAG: hypothetical protein H6Q16_1816 [Bacteroidetes bacterium]|nr:hypothetical protein [Bacteroidota bacterium]
MTTQKNEKLFSKQWIKAYALILVGSFLFAAGDVMFVNPYRLAPGGTYGLANVFNTLWPWKISYYAFCMDIPLLLIGTWILGPRFGIKTVVSTFLILGFVWLLESTWGYNPVIHDGFIANALPGQLNFVPDYFLNTLVAGLIYGLAIGMIFKSGATSGGSDIIAMILNKYTKISLGTLVLIVDSTITLTTLFAFGQFRLPIYSILLIVIESKIIDMVIDGIKTYKTLFIVSDKYDDVRNAILNDLNRGGTCINCMGMYQGTERKIIYTTVSRTEFVKLKEGIKGIDPNAFINVVDSSEILGKGFKEIQAN